jgi:hypothetical protein
LENPVFASRDGCTDKMTSLERYAILAATTIVALLAIVPHTITPEVYIPASSGVDIDPILPVEL